MRELCIIDWSLPHPYGNTGIMYHPIPLFITTRTEGYSIVWLSERNSIRFVWLPRPGRDRTLPVVSVDEFIGMLDEAVEAGGTESQAGDARQTASEEGVSGMQWWYDPGEEPLSTETVGSSNVQVFQSELFDSGGDGLPGYAAPLSGIGVYPPAEGFTDSTIDAANPVPEYETPDPSG